MLFILLQKIEMDFHCVVFIANNTDLIILNTTLQ